MWNTIVDLLKQSVIMQSILTILVVSVWLYLILTAKPVPPLLETIVGVIVGFFFGSKVTQGLQSMRK